MKNGHASDKVPAGSGEQCALLEARVQSRLNGLLRDFHVDIRKEGLVLRGYTHTYYAKQLAQHAVMQASSLPIAANEIVVC